MEDIEELKELVAKKSRGVADQKRVNNLIAELARAWLAGPGHHVQSFTLQL